jgi:hypothetical protein
MIRLESAGPAVALLPRVVTMPQRYALGSAERIEFSEADDQQISIYGGEAIRAIVRSCDAGPDPIEVAPDLIAAPKTVTATLYSYGPVFDAKAKNWRFKHQRKPIYADISETNIAKDAVRRGGSFMNDRYRSVFGGL